MKLPDEFKLTDALPFGKYRDKTIEYIIDNYPDYLEWCLDNIDGFDLDEDAEYALDAALNDSDDGSNDWAKPDHMY